MLSSKLLAVAAAFVGAVVAIEAHGSPICESAAPVTVTVTVSECDHGITGGPTPPPSSVNPHPPPAETTFLSGPPHEGTTTTGVPAPHGMTTIVHGPPPHGETTITHGLPPLGETTITHGSPPLGETTFVNGHGETTIIHGSPPHGWTSVGTLTPLTSAPAPTQTFQATTVTHEPGSTRSAEGYTDTHTHSRPDSTAPNASDTALPSETSSPGAPAFAGATPIVVLMVLLNVALGALV